MTTPTDETTERWKKAQTYERDWWAGVVSRIDPSFYERYAEELTRELAGLMTIRPDTWILEVGSGAAGILTYLDSRHRYAVDPLEDFYASVDRFTAARDGEVHYARAQGEHLPFENERFDLIIIDNVLDHCEQPARVVQEMHRVLRKGGIVFLRLNVYHRWGKAVRALAETLQIDKGHPYTFTWDNLEHLLRSNAFELVRVHRTPFRDTWIKELTSGKPRDLLKAMTFATRSKTTCVLRKP